MTHAASITLATAGKRFSSAVRRLSLAVAISGYFTCSALAVAAPLNISDTPLFLTGGVKPNLLMAIDDSGSMDFETLVPGNDGAAWWRADGRASGSCLNNVDDASFTGCVSNDDPTNPSDVPGSGKLNFNASGNADATWKKYSYLFPNGFGNTRQDRRRINDDVNAHFAIPPLGVFGWSRSAEYNAAYFDPGEKYEPWQDGGGYTFDDAPPTATRFDPIYNGHGTINLERDFAGNGNVDPANDCTNASMPNVADNYYFRVYPGMTIPEGTCMRRRVADGAVDWPGNDWVKVAAGGCVVAANPGALGCPVYINGAGGVTNTRTLRNNEGAGRPALVAIRYFPATFFASAANPPPAIFGFDGAKKIADGLAPDGVTVLYRYEIKLGNFDTPEQYDAAIQNFANWFGYYRKRHMALRAGLGNAFNGVNNMRVGGFTINQTSSPNSPDVNMAASDIDVAANRAALYNKFYYDWTGTGGTPNRQAVANLVRNYQRTGAGAPVTASCQRNFGMLFTDGYSNAPAGGDGITGLANLDDKKGTPYEDTYAGSVADLTMSAYENNLRPDFTAGLVQPPSACSDAVHDPWLDCNKNLHMNFYAVTLGTRGIAYDPDAPAYSEYTTAPTWPTAFPARHPSAVDDLWHATINGRGRLLNAKRPSDLATQLSEVLRNVADASGSAASASVSSGTVSSTLNNRAFTVSFDTKHWSGTLRASQIFPDGTYGKPMTATIPVDENDREIITTDSAGNAIPFRWANVSADATRKAALGAIDAVAQARLEYLRGSRAEEATGTFRVRSGALGAEVLGDIVNSAPVYVGAPPFTYKDSLEADAYSAFSQKPANKDRPRMIYVGANDGMLHGFKTTDDVAEPLVEAFAYIPGPVFKKLSLLTSPAYTHRFYVDGTVAMTDAYYAKKGIGAKEWRTVLAGGLNKGGQGIYVLDVTNPNQLNESNAKDIVEWEFSDEQDADLGYTYSRPAVVRMHDDKWYVVFGNGYDSTDDAGGTDTNIGSGKAVLYIVDLATGVLKTKIELPGGTVANPNGLSTPAVVDLDGDDVVDFAYAGDLHGNMWKFDLRDKDPLKWDVLKNGGAPVALFVAQDAGGDRQPITTRPQVGRGPRGAGQVVLFGTGRFLKNSDRDITYLDTQTFYGVHDSALSVASLPLGRGNLVKQQVLDEQTVAGIPVRITSTNVVGATDKGWYMDLLKNDTIFEGEMSISDSVLRNGRIAFATLIPDPDPCKSGGRSWFMLLDALSGARIVGSTFDVDGNKTFGTEDMGKFGAADVLVSGVGSTDGIMSQPRFVAAPGGDLGLVTDTLNRQFSFLINSGNRIGRQSWRQLR
jgi:type IV pilus assembly protein PilY1